MDIISFLNSWQFVLGFYIFIFYLVYNNKNKFDFPAKFIAMYKTKLGIKTMQRWADKHTKLIQRLGYVGIFIGYLGMLIIMYFIFQGIVNLVFRPEAPPTISPIIPGVKIPGSPLFVPFWYGMISLFVVVVIHEFSHGLVAKAHKIKIKSSGFVLFGPLPGAFVEPDEEALEKKSAAVQNSIFAAGPFSNILTALLVFVLFALVIAPVVDNQFHSIGFELNSVESGFPAEVAGLETGVIYNTINGETATNTKEFFDTLQNLKPSEQVTIGNEDITHSINPVEHPENSSKGYLGVTCCITRFSNEGLKLNLMLTLIEFLNWVFILSLGLGLANLLPLGPVDGGRMFRIACRRFLGKKRGDKVWAKTSIWLFVIIIALLIIPIARGVLA